MPYVLLPAVMVPRFVMLALLPKTLMPYSFVVIVPKLDTVELAPLKRIPVA